MPQSLPLTGVVVPEMTDTDQVAIDLYNTLSDIESFVVTRFPSQSVADALITSPVTGQVRFLINPGIFQRYNGVGWAPWEPQPTSYVSTNTGSSGIFQSSSFAQWFTADYTITPTHTGYADVTWGVDIGSDGSGGYQIAYIDLRRDGTPIARSMPPYGASIFSMEQARDFQVAHSTVPQLLEAGVSTTFSVYVASAQITTGGDGWHINDSTWTIVQR